MDERFKPYAAVLMMLVKGDSILLLRRANTDWANGIFTLPSGHIDKGESVIRAGIRETEEETGVTVDEKSVSFAHVLHRKNQENERVYIDFFLKATSWSGEPKIMEPNKCDIVEWFNLNNLPENIIPFVRNVIHAHYNNVYLSEEGWTN